jgi:hypothetical protein
MAKIITRTWKARGSNGRRVKRTAYGYTLMVNGQRERRVSEEWTTKEEALAALLARQKEIAAGQVERTPERTLGQLAEEYLVYKKAKPSLREDTRYLERQFLPAFGSSLPVRKLTTPMIAQWERRRSADASPYTVANELTVFKHMLRLARKWGYLDTVPEIEMPKDPGDEIATCPRTRSSGSSTPATARRTRPSARWCGWPSTRACAGGRCSTWSGSG